MRSESELSHCPGLWVSGLPSTESAAPGSHSELKSSGPQESAAACPYPGLHSLLRPQVGGNRSMGEEVRERQC